MLLPQPIFDSLMETTFFREEKLNFAKWSSLGSKYTVPNIVATFKNVPMEFITARNCQKELSQHDISTSIRSIERTIINAYDSAYPSLICIIHSNIY